MFSLGIERKAQKMKPKKYNVLIASPDETLAMGELQYPNKYSLRQPE